MVSTRSSTARQAASARAASARAAPARQASARQAPAPRQRMPATEAQSTAFREYLTRIQPPSSKPRTVSQNTGNLAGVVIEMNLVPSPPSLRFIETNMDEIIRYIETVHNERHPNNQWSDATILKKLTSLSAFANIGKSFDPPEVTDAVYERIKAVLAARSSARNIERSQQKLSPRQEKNWVPFDKIEERAREHVDRFLDFYNSKRRITAASTDAEKNIIRFALIALLYVFEIPPRSQPYNDAIIVNYENGIPEGRLAKGKRNFIDVHNPKAIMVGCCDDKIINEEKPYAKPDKWQLLETTSDLIMLTLKVWDRTHLFGNGPVANGTFTTMIQRCFTWPAGATDQGEAVGEKVVGLQILRTIYASTWYATSKKAPQRPGENTTPGEANLANRMRHDPDTQRTHYLKFVDEIRNGIPTRVAAPEDPPCEGEFVYSPSVAAMAARIRYAENSDAIKIKNLERYHADPQTVNQRRYLRKIARGERVKKSTMDKWGIFCVEGKLQA